MMYRTRNPERQRFYNSHGSHLIPTYERRVQADGTVELEQVGQKDIYLEIQSGVKGLTPYELLDRYSHIEDPSILKQQEKMYADFTAAPRSLAELEQFRIDARNAFNSLPVRVRELFGNNYQIFMQNPEKAAEFFAGFEKRSSGEKVAESSAIIGGGTPTAAPVDAAGSAAGVSIK